MGRKTMFLRWDAIRVVVKIYRWDAIRVVIKYFRDAIRVHRDFQRTKH